MIQAVGADSETKGGTLRVVLTHRVFRSNVGGGSLIVVIVPPR